jgi:hypothetical protein
MNTMRRPTQSRLSLYVGLVSSAVAACSGAGQDGLVTVGVRPTSDRGAAQGGNAVGGPIVLPSGTDVMDESPDENSSTAQNVAPVATPEVSAGTFARGPVAGTRSAPTAASSATFAGAGGAGVGAAGSLAERSANEDECGAVPSQPAGNVSSGLVNGAGLIEYDVKASNVFTGLRTTLVVPATPEPNGPVFVWPGIQPAPSGPSFEPIGNGALMSVLSWGTACAAEAPGSDGSWWVASMYSNLSSADPQYSGCHSGKVALVEPTQLVDIDIHLEGATWIQKMVNRSTGEASELSLDLHGQEQGRAFFAIAPQTANKPTEDIVFTHSVLAMEVADPDACAPVMRGTNDFASKPRVSADGKHCCIDRIVLRAARVTPTTIDPP